MLPALSPPYNGGALLCKVKKEHGVNGNDYWMDRRADGEMFTGKLPGVMVVAKETFLVVDIPLSFHWA
ncbi:hypothetical protein L1987_44564 [Smallanthus sonchifolius]|uniref:Uncharacterized protein n=1 Tax=Smallanthus sonchifolius TaxID=185202 RepID=A0ACB9GQV7_9ASTR|nr:hypothetical protein L1987_44564 [Smallanthus sonchifolius]